MSPKLEETIYLDFITSSSTGAAADADSTPTAEVFEDATDTSILSPTVTKRTSKTGNYRIPVACTTANGFEEGKTYNVIASATVGGVSAKAKIATFQVRTTYAANVTQIAGGTTSISGSGNVNFVRGQSVATANLFPSNFSLANLVPGENLVGYDFVVQISGAEGTFTTDVSSGSLNSIQGIVENAIEAIEGGADSATIAAAVAAALAGNAVNVSSLVVSRGVMQLVAGDKYTTERMQPFTRTGWTGSDLDTLPGKMLFIPLGVYDENANEDVATLVVAGTFSQTGTTVTMNFPMTVEQTTTLNPARSGKGITEYKVQVRANDPIGETVWLGRAEVSRNISE